MMDGPTWIFAALGILAMLLVWAVVQLGSEVIDGEGDRQLPPARELLVASLGRPKRFRW